MVFENSVWRTVCGTDFLLSAVQAWHRYPQRAAYRPQLPHQETSQTWRMVVSRRGGGLRRRRIPMSQESPSQPTSSSAQSSGQTWTLLFPSKRRLLWYVFQPPALSFCCHAAYVSDSYSNGAMRIQPSMFSGNALLVSSLCSRLCM